MRISMNPDLHLRAESGSCKLSHDRFYARPGSGGPRSPSEAAPRRQGQLYHGSYLLISLSGSRRRPLILV
jgi:hypothetical protein